MNQMTGTTVTILLGWWELALNRKERLHAWQRTDYFIIGLGVERHRP